MGLSIAISRTSLGLGVLTISGTKPATPATAGWWVPAGGFRRPAWRPRRVFAPDSAYIADRQPLGTVLDEGTWTLRVAVRGTSDANLAARRAELAAAVSQWRYQVTVTLDGVQETWMCNYAWPDWPESPQWQRLGHEDRADLVIPVRVP